MNVTCPAPEATVWPAEFTTEKPRSSPSRPASTVPAVLAEKLKYCASVEEKIVSPVTTAELIEPSGHRLARVVIGLEPVQLESAAAWSAGPVGG